MTLTGQAAILAALDNHPYARFTTAMASAPEGVTLGETVVWWGDTALGRLAHAFGPPVDLPAIEGLHWLNLPHEWPVPQGFSVREEWDFRWTTVSPRWGEHRVSRIDDPLAVTQLLDAGHPGSPLRPGHPLVKQWWGIWKRGQLVACAADRTSGDVGVIGAVTVHPDHRGRGYGRSVSAELTWRLVDTYGLCCLGVTEGNVTATRLYESLGYGDVHGIRSVTLARGPDHL